MATITLALGYSGNPSGYHTETVSPKCVALSGGGYHDFRVRLHRSGWAALRRAKRLECKHGCTCDGCHVAIAPDEADRMIANVRARGLRADDASELLYEIEYVTDRS